MADQEKSDEGKAVNIVPREDGKFREGVETNIERIDKTGIVDSDKPPPRPKDE